MKLFEAFQNVRTYNAEHTSNLANMKTAINMLKKENFKHATPEHKIKIVTYNDIELIKLHSLYHIRAIIVTPPYMFLTTVDDKVFKVKAQDEEFDAEKGLSILLNKMYLCDDYYANTTSSQFHKLLSVMENFNKEYIKEW